MDSLTQIVLGAAVGELLLGRQLGNRAVLLGAIGGTIPDMDVVYNFISDDPIRQLQVHRGYSHSVFTHMLAAFPLVWFSKKLSRNSITASRWYLFWFMVLFTHALLDCCTTYGTQLLLPFTNYQVAFNNISVIDPLYTIPFLILLVAGMFFKRNNPVRRNILYSALTVSSLYMVFTFGAKVYVHNTFRESLNENNISYNELNSTPTILNALLWSGIAFNDSMLYVTDYSLLKEEPVKWIAYRRHLELLPAYDSESLNTIKWFSDGNYFVRPTAGDTLEFYNVKFGRMRYDTVEPDKTFLFYWKFYIDGHQVKYIEIRQDDWTFKEALAMLMERIGI